MPGIRSRQFFHMYEYFHLLQCRYMVNCDPKSLSWYSDSLLAGRSGERIRIGARYSVPVKTDDGTQPELL